MKINVALLLLLITNYTVALSEPDYKFGKVSEEEIAETKHPLEPEAEAAILYKKERVYYDYNIDKGWYITKEYHYRIKIYNKEGFNWATLQVPLYVSGGDEERISSVRGYTFNLVDGKVESEKLQKNGVFVEEVNKFRNKASITMPEVKEGSVLDIEYNVSSPLYWYLDDFLFQYDIPVNNVYLRLDIPQYFFFKRYGKGYYPIKLDESKERRSIKINYRSNNEADQLLGRTHKSGSIDFDENVYEVKATNLPSLREEAFTNNINNYRTALKFELASTQFPNRPYKNYSLSWEDVAKSIYDYDDFGPELSKTKYFEEDISKLLQGEMAMNEKIMLIYNFVKSRMTWDGYSGVGCSKGGIKESYSEGVGNVADINLMLTSMMRYAGIKANPILVSTRSHGIPLFPTTDGFNYVICGVEVQDNVILLDATERNAYPNILPNRALNWMGRLVREDGSSSSINLVPVDLSQETHYLQVQINQDGSVEGKSRTQYSNQFAMSVRNNIDTVDETVYMENLETEYGEMDITEYDLKNKRDYSKPLIESCSFSRENQCEIIGEDIYFKPMLFLAKTENPFKMEKRIYPVDFTFPRQEKYIIGINIPEGYKVQSLPENVTVQLPDNLGKFSFNIMSNGNTVNVNVSSEINSAFFPANYYDVIKEYYKNLVEKQSEKVVLSKI
ncbi:DUF3857 domain-containing protein [Flagellimonas meishanensis]|uniref:DUF3857 domain-containing protein n=1 Tax=Flagellimonas meishanensis TaxID=2873264 RepID=UPI001CA6E91A|nr:DUF3857 domain-containing protein [[Muricauda] meishanensis]